MLHVVCVYARARLSKRYRVERGELAPGERTGKLGRSGERQSRTRLERPEWSPVGWPPAAGDHAASPEKGGARAR